MPLGAAAAASVCHGSNTDAALAATDNLSQNSSEDFSLTICMLHVFRQTNDAPGLPRGEREWPKTRYLPITGDGCSDKYIYIYIYTYLTG
jgi:hypothetical protein